MTSAIMQPTFNPWLGYFDMIDQADIFVLYDDVQLSKQSWQVRNRIKTANGELFLSIPYLKSDNWRELLICSAQTNETLPWRIKHLKSIENAYKRAPFFEEVFDFIKNFYEAGHGTISAFNSAFIKQVSTRLGIGTKMINSAESLTSIEGAKDVRLANICKHLKCDVYISPQGSADYIEEVTPGGELVKAGIEVYYHNYKHPEYRQLFGEFMPYMGIMDLLLNVGFSDSLEVIRKGRQELINYKDFKKEH